MGLWKGLGPNIARNAIINAAELASYDQIKESLLATGYFKVGALAARHFRYHYRRYSVHRPTCCRSTV